MVSGGTHRDARLQDKLHDGLSVWPPRTLCFCNDRVSVVLLSVLKQILKGKSAIFAYLYDKSCLSWSLSRYTRLMCCNENETWVTCFVRVTVAGKTFIFKKQNVLWKRTLQVLMQIISKIVVSGLIDSILNILLKFYYCLLHRDAKYKCNLNETPYTGVPKQCC